MVFRENEYVSIINQHILHLCFEGDNGELSCGQGAHGDDNAEAIRKVGTLIKAKPLVPARQS